MGKKVYCLIPPRRKAIKLTERPGVSDAEILRDCFFKACESDPTLKLMTQNKITVFQIRDDNGEWCDIESDDKIQESSEVNVLLIAMDPSATETNSTTTNKLDTLKPGDIMPLDINVLYEEPSHLVSNQSEKDKLDLGNESFKQTSRPEEQSMDIKVKVERKENISMQSKLHKLPPLTLTLTKQLKNGKVDPAKSKDFFKHWGEYLYQETGGTPTKSEYAKFATSIVSTFPELGGGSSDIGIVRSQLSTWIRNYRTTLKCKTNPGPSSSQTLKRDSSESVKYSKADSALVEPHITLTASDIQSALKELEKPYKKGKNISHVERLLQDTKDYRKNWIQQQSGNIPDIISKYPALGDPHMIAYECVSVIFEKKISDILEVVENVIDVLYNYYVSNPAANCSSKLREVIENRTDRVDAMVIEQFCKDMLPNNLKNKALNPLWCVHEVLTSVENLKSAELAAPRAILYFSTDDVLTQAFIAADKEVKIEICDPTIASILLTLLSTYYSWHLEYPTAYYSVLDFLYNQVFDVKLRKQNGGAAKFIRTLQNFVKSAKNQ